MQLFDSSVLVPWWRTRHYGQVALRDHAQDMPIALGAWRARAELFTVNRQDLERWQGLLRRAGKRITVRDGLWAVRALQMLGGERAPE